MIKIKINNNEFEAPEGMTILDVATNAGIKIPTLCFKKGLPHYSSCMACMVKDKRTNSFIPSCSALIQEGMDIDASGDEVIELRKKAVELLLSEHRAECEAPCSLVCPAGYNIPFMNRLLIAKDFEAAIKFSLSSVKSTEIHCVNCAAYCENACRRKKVDQQVSIRNLQLFIYNQIKDEIKTKDNHLHFVSVVKESKKTKGNEVEAEVETKKGGKRFNSLIGKLEPSELQEWVKECAENLVRFRDISDFDAAASEAESCMHCDCRAKDDCRLRDLSEDYSLKNPRGKLINAPIVKKININTGLIFENAKCIKCGLCVRLCEDLKEEPALCFIHRGFVSIISEPLTVDFNDIIPLKSKEVIEICPTGALSQLK
jgi:predicted molibdopterin-dependent oxidoreductase YjgC